VAVSTGGHSPALAGWLRDRLCAELGPHHAIAATLLSEARVELAAAGRSTEGLDWQGAFDSGMFTSIRAGKIDQAREQLRACLSLS
jgi:siroheme synthase (precorrin-2 oxidase/ferrochelatase)